jgi:predicted N-acetyltransferase YhbS
MPKVLHNVAFDICPIIEDLMIESYTKNPWLYESCLSLLDTCFPGIKQLADAGKSHHAHWDQISIPFVHTVNGEVVGHVGLIPFHLMINGQSYTAAALHGICVRAVCRRQGIFTELMHEAMIYVRQHYDFAFLFADTASLYEPFGFKRVDEYNFELEDIPHRGTLGAIRKIDLDNPVDLKLVQDIIARRLPISEQIGIVQEQVIFILDTLSKPLYYSEKHQSLIAYFIEDKTLYIRDIVFTQPIKLEEILSCIAEPYSKIILQFCPTRFQHLTYNPIKSTPEDFLMVSEEFPLDTLSLLRFPETGRC